MFLNKKGSRIIKNDLNFTIILDTINEKKALTFSTCECPGGKPNQTL